jgi:hypothetical protein
MYVSVSAALFKTFGMFRTYGLMSRQAGRALRTPNTLLNFRPRTIGTHISS